MRLLTTTIAASVLFTVAAKACEDHPWVPPHFSTAPINSTDRINEALAAQGKPPLGHVIYESRSTR